MPSEAEKNIEYIIQTTRTIEYPCFSVMYRGPRGTHRSSGMNANTRRKSLRDEAYYAITRHTDDERLAPGSRLIVSALADELRLSATPINEALSALDREGLVSYAPHRGYSVRALTIGDIEEVFTVRE